MRFFFSRTWLLSVLAEGWANVLSDLRFFSFFQRLDSTRLDSMKYNHIFFPRCCEHGSWLCAGKMRIYIYFFGFFMSKT